MKKRLLSMFLIVAMLLSCLPVTAALQSGKLMTMRYDDHLDVSGRGASIVDAGTPTSYQVGYGVAENTPDTAVVTLEGNTLIATGVGTAKVSLDGTEYTVTVEAAPISLFLLIGQSNMEGDEGKAEQSVVCPDGQVYSTYVPRADLTADTAASYVPSALTGTLRDTNVNGTTDGISTRPVYALTEAGNGKMGMDSGFGYQWVQSTGEKVWLVNAAHGGSEINEWQKGASNYNEAVALFSGCQETLKKEIAAGHYTLSHMGYFWNQGCGDDQKEAQWYTEKFLAMHEALKAALSADMDSDPTTPDQTLEFAYLVATLAGGEGRKGYRFGGHENTSFGFYSTYEELEMRGHRVSHRWMASNPDLKDIYMISNLGEKMLSMPDRTDGVEEYFKQQYPDGIVDYPVQERQKASWYQPTTPLEFKDTVHYNQIGYNEVGRDAARNAAIMLNYQPDTQEETTVTFTDWTGYKPVSNIQASQLGHSGTLVVPMVEPCYRAKEVSWEFSDGLSYEYFDLIADTNETTGTLTAVGFDGEQVSVAPKTAASYRWDMESGTTLVSTGPNTNTIVRRQGSHQNNVFSYMLYRMSTPIVLEHDEAWALEFKMTGPWDSAIKLFSEDGSKNTKDSFAVMANGEKNQLAMGYYDGSAYQRWGVALADYGIDLADTHIYRLLNRVNEDGSNTIVLFVDGKEIAPMTTHFNTGETSTELSGHDFALNHMGAAGNTLNNGTFIYIAAEERGASEQTHFHDFAEWEILSVPTSKALGQKKGQCTICGEYETRELQGVWQMLGLNARIQPLPEKLYAQTNLCDVLPDVLGYYSETLNWLESQRSVTVEINPGERIYSSSFGKAGTNGSADTNGCSLIFFSPYGLIKYMTPAEVYAEFSANNCVTAPDNAVIANIVLWTDAGDYERLNKVQLIDRPTGYVPLDGDVFYIPGRVLKGCIGEGYVIATQNENLTVGELVDVAIPEGTSGANNSYGGSWDHFWEMKNDKLNRVSGGWYGSVSADRFRFGYHDTITDFTDTTLSIAHAVGHTGNTTACGYNFDDACGNSKAATRNYECAGSLAIAEDLKIIDLTGHNAKKLADVKVLTDAGRAVINVYAPDGASSGTGGSGDHGKGLVSGTASVIVVVDPTSNYIPPEGEMLMSGDVFFIPDTVVAGELVQAYVVDSASKTVGSKVAITIPEGTTGANGKYSGRFWEVANGTIQLIYNVTLKSDGSQGAAPGANRYGYHDVIHGINGATITIKGITGHYGSGGTCVCGFAESCDAGTTTKYRSAYEVGPVLTLPETYTVLDLRSDVLAGKADAVTTAEEIKALTSAKHAVVNTYAANGHYTPKYSESNTTGYLEDAGTVTAFVVVDFSSGYTASYKQTVGTVTNGKVELSAAEGIAGTSITVTATPNEGYELETVLVDGKPINGNVYSIRGLHTVTASFKLPTEDSDAYTITVADDIIGGTVTVDHDKASDGETITVTATPADSYVFKAILVNGQEISGTTFTASENAEVTAIFAKVVKPGDVMYFPGNPVGLEYVEGYLVSSDTPERKMFFYFKDGFTG